ncbi:G5 domain-containing protein [Erysipelothrix amsterdamensis]|uniref:G5 domain-containing protein n=1 Tax=Erysipelothrix amsterdamensis TaxID=2929157 RepID=A0AAU9VHD5_9FIRM|nr:G5 domain-containing protein [Erysipelothrix sp. A18Y020d]CAH2763001.1 G5 domain-containing protein [Erysipelothrix sp. A18Y020d]
MKVKKKYIIGFFGLLVFCLGCGVGYFQGISKKTVEQQPPKIMKKNLINTKRSKITKTEQQDDLEPETADHFVEDYRSEETPIPFDTLEKNDESMNQGETITDQEGKAGLKRTVYKELYKNNDLVDSSVQYTEVVYAPVDEITRVGIKEIIVNSEQIDKEASLLMFNHVNQIRKDHQLDVLTWSESLFEYAGIRAVDLEKSFEHRRPDGSSWDSLNPQLIFAENLAKRAFSVESAMNGFMESPSHRANILDDFKSGACALYQAPDGNWYWVQLFGY